MIAAIMMAAGVASAQDDEYPGVDPEAYKSGCLDPGATMYVWVDKGDGRRTELYVRDDDGDGFPESVWCENGERHDVMLPGSPGCTVERLTCDPAISVWIGTPGPDHANCGSVEGPVLMFAGAGADQLVGSTLGDFIQGGPDSDLIIGDRSINNPHIGGGDFICGSGADSAGNMSFGGPGDDLIWGGPNPDHVFGGRGDDLIQSAVGSDTAYGGPGDDWIHGGDLHDQLFGGRGNDVLHGGHGVDDLQGGPGRDVLEGQDGFADRLLGDGGKDHCISDPAELVGSCESDTIQPLCDNTFPLLVGSLGGVLHERTLEGQGGFSGLVSDAGTGIVYPEVRSLAVDPTDCRLYALLADDLGQQTLATIERDAQGPPSSGYPARAFCQPVDHELVDIAFDGQGRLAALSRDALWLPVDKAGSPCIDDPGATRVGRGEGWDAAVEGQPTGYRMAWDDPDGGFFLILSADIDFDQVGRTDPVDRFSTTHSAMDAFHAPSGLSMSMEVRIPRRNLGQHPFTVTPVDDVGHLLSIEPQAGRGGCPADEYRLLRLKRRNWEIQPWDKGESCQDEGTPCCTRLAGAPTAITVPHYLQPSPRRDTAKFFTEQAIAFGRDLTRTQLLADAQRQSRALPADERVALERIATRLEEISRLLRDGCANPVAVGLDVKHCTLDRCAQVVHEPAADPPIECALSTPAVLGGILFNERLDEWVLSFPDPAEPDRELGGLRIWKSCDDTTVRGRRLSFCAETAAWYAGEILDDEGQPIDAGYFLSE